MGGEAITEAYTAPGFMGVLELSGTGSELPQVGHAPRASKSGPSEKDRGRHQAHFSSAGIRQPEARFLLQNGL